MKNAAPHLQVKDHLVKLEIHHIERFWSKVDRDGPTPDQNNPFYAGLGPCWVWTAGLRGSKDYGLFSFKDRPFKASRVAWVIHHGGSILSSDWILHRCDNPKCCNPGHLFRGTPRDNSQDRDKKGRNAPRFGDPRRELTPDQQVRGHKHGRSKLTEERVNLIKERYSIIKNQRIVAFEFGICQAHVSRIVQGKNWAHIE